MNENVENLNTAKESRIRKWGFYYELFPKVGDKWLDILESERNDDEDKYILKTGFNFIDNTSPFERGQMIIIAADTGVGKTSFIMSMIENISMVKKNPTIVVFSVEMNKYQMTERLTLSSSRKNRNLFYKKELNYMDENDQDLIYGDIKNRVDIFKNKNLIFLDDYRLTVEDITKYSREISKEIGQIDYVMVDYIQDVETLKKSFSKEDRMHHVAKELKALSLELNCAVLPLSQINDEYRQSLRVPNVKDLSDSKYIGKVADKCMIIHRENHFPLENQKNRGHALIIIDKDRYGEQGFRSLMRFDEKCTNFSEMTEEEIKKIIEEKGSIWEESKNLYSNKIQRKKF